MSTYRTVNGRPIGGDEVCWHCRSPISFYSKFGIEAWRHGRSGSEFCRAEGNSILRATPNGEETR